MKANFFQKICLVLIFAVVLGIFLPAISHVSYAEPDPNTGVETGAGTKEEEKKQEDRAKALNPGRNSPNGNARKEAEEKEKNPTKEEKEAKERVEKDKEKEKKKEKDEEKKVEEDKGTENDSAKNSPDGQAREKHEEDASSKGEGKLSLKGKDDKWTLYAQIIMGSAIEHDKKAKSKGVIEKSFEGAISGIIGDGGVSLDIPYTKFSALNKELTGKDLKKYEGGEQGQALASTLATFNQYGYFNTVSGNEMALGTFKALTGMGRGIAGIVAFFSLILYALMSKLLEWTLQALVFINPYHLLGMDKGKSVFPEDNFISQAISNFFDGLGLNGDFFSTLLELGMIVITFIFVIQLLIYIFRAKLRKIGEKSTTWITRLFVVFVGLPVMAITASSISKTASEYIKGSQVDDAPAISHIVDTRAWASGLNLSPNALQSSQTPAVGASGNYIDTEYQPATRRGRERIANINKESYKRLYKVEDNVQINFLLLTKWMASDNFNVNTYIADLRSDASLPGVANFIDEYAKAKKLSASEKEKLSRRDLEYAMWGATQNVDDERKKPDNKNYDPTAPIGVYNDSSFSTQSVSLMLQSSFDNSSAKFYAYNFAPSGQQSNIKNLTTVKTEWREATLPGDGMVGVFGSWLSLISKSLTYVIITSAVIIALFTTVMFQALIAFIKQGVQALVFGSIHSLLATFLIFLGGIGSLLIAVSLPGLFIGLVEDIQSGLYKATKSFVPGGFIEIVASLLSLWGGYWLGYGGRIGPTEEAPASLISTFFTKMALDFSKRVAEMNRQGNANFGVLAKGVSQSARSTHRDTSSKLGYGLKQSGTSLTQGAKGGLKGAGAGGLKGAVKGATVGFATGGVTGALAGGAKSGLKGAGAGMYKGAKAGRKATDTSKESLNSLLANEGLARPKFNELKNSAGKLNSKDIANVAGKSHDRANMSNSANKQMLDKYEKLQGEEACAKVNENASGADKYRDLYDPNKPMSSQYTGNPDDLDKIEGSHNLYNNASPEELQRYSELAGYEAREAVHKVGNEDRPVFTREEADSLAEADNENDFVSKLGKTKNGLQYALGTANAKNLLQNSRFTDKEGNVSMNKVREFQNVTDRARNRGELSKQDIQDKARLDNAFVMGAKEKYRRPNKKFANSFGTIQTQNTGKKTTNNTQTTRTQSTTPKQHRTTSQNKQRSANVNRRRRPTQNHSNTMKQVKKNLRPRRPSNKK